MARIPRSIVFAVAIVTAFRLIVGARVPLTEDETYYWMWSSHPAFGYLDHPPMVAWLIAATSFLGHSPIAVRVLFIACEGLAAIFAGLAAAELSGTAAAAGASSLVFLLIPQIRFAFGEALPDPPYLCFWALALWMAVRLRRRGAWIDFVALGIALGGTLLSRFFGWALAFGVVAWSSSAENRELWSRGLWVSFVIALAAYVPFLAYDAAHGWQNMVFTMHDRQSLTANHAAEGGLVSTLRFLTITAVLCIAAYFVTIRARYAILAWTALPLTLFLAAIAPFENVESYWLLGPLTSLCVGIGIAYVRARRPVRAVLQGVLYAGAAIVAITAAFTALPERTQASMLRSGGIPKGSMNDGVYAWAPLASRVASIALRRHAAVLTDVFETNSELTYYGLEPIFIGEDGHVRQWRRWHANAAVPRNAVFVGYDRGDPKTMAMLSHAYVRVAAGPDIAIAFAGRPVAHFYTAFYSQPRRDAATGLWDGY